MNENLWKSINYLTFFFTNKKSFFKLAVKTLKTNKCEMLGGFAHFFFFCYTSYVFFDIIAISVYNLHDFIFPKDPYRNIIFKCHFKWNKQQREEEKKRRHEYNIFTIFSLRKKIYVHTVLLHTEVYVTVQVLCVYQFAKHSIA